MMLRINNDSFIINGLNKANREQTLKSENKNNLATMLRSLKIKKSLNQ